MGCRGGGRDNLEEWLSVLRRNHGGGRVVSGLQKVRGKGRVKRGLTGILFKWVVWVWAGKCKWAKVIRLRFLDLMGYDKDPFGLWYK